MVLYVYSGKPWPLLRCVGLFTSCWHFEFLIWTNACGPHSYMSYFLVNVVCNIFFTAVQSALLVIWRALHIIINGCWSSVYIVTCVVHFLGSSRGVSVTLSDCGCASGIKQLAVLRSAYSFDPGVQIHLKVDKCHGQEEPFCTENKLCLNLEPCLCFCFYVSTFSESNLRCLISTGTRLNFDV